MTGSPNVVDLLDNIFQVLSDLADHYAFELYVHTDDHGLASAVDAEDSGIVSFRRGLMLLRAAQREIGDRALGLERRLERTYDEGFGGPLPPLGEGDGVPFTKIIWEAMEGKD